MISWLSPNSVNDKAVGLVWCPPGQFSIPNGYTIISKDTESRTNLHTSLNPTLDVEVLSFR